MRAVILLAIAMAASAVSPAGAAPAGPASPGAPAPAGAATQQAFDAVIERTKKTMMTDPDAALVLARRAVAMSRRLPPSPRGSINIATADWLHGEALSFLNDLSGATPIIAGALARVERDAPDTKLHGDLLRAQGALMSMTGQVQRALQDYQRAHDVFQRAGEARSRAMTLQDMGRMYWDAGDHDRTFGYFEKSVAIFPDDPVLSLTRQNNRGETYRKLGRFADATVAYRAALLEARRLGSAMLQVRILTNLAEMEAGAGNVARAEQVVEQAMRLSARSEAAGWRPFVYGAWARVEAKKGNYRRAADLLGQTFKGQDLTKTDVSFREYHQTAIDVFDKLGQAPTALAHARSFQRLEGETRQLTASVASQLMAARFDFTSQNLEISKLKQDQLARDIATERDKTRTRTVMLGALLVAAAVVFGILLFGFFAIRRSRDQVAAANTSLTDVNGALEKALTAKTEFLATTSHEIRTPLNGILGMTQVLLADRGIDAAVRERIEVVHGAGETMKALVDDILDVAKMESGELTVASEPTDLPPILDDAARLWGGQAQAKGLELVLDMTGAPKRIVSDGGRLRQIVFNLMSNALKFTSVGRVTLFAGVETAADGGEMLAIRVVDTGIGIPLDQQAAIFEAFKQVDGGTTRQFGGTGLGLAICKKLAIALGGDIRVTSVIGQGTTFEALLPLVRAEIEKVSTAEPEHDGTLGEARMLILDRNPLNQGVMRVLLGAEAGHVAVAETVAETLAALEGPDAPTHLVIDAGSIAGEHVDLLSALRDVTGGARAAGAHCSLLLAPAAAGLTIAEAMAVGAEQLIVKPIGAADLMTALKSLYGDDPDSLVAPDLLGARAA